MEQVWNFSQKTYRETYFADKNLSGSCYALTARWTKMMSKAPKNNKFVPNLTKADRDKYFNDPGKADNIQKTQEKFDTGIKTSQVELAKIDQSVLALKTARKQDPLLDLSPQIAAVQMAADRQEVSLKSVHRDVVASYKLTVREEAQCPGGFSDYFKATEANGCYIFLGSNTNHATAGFVTGGTFWQDYYFFDPNYGEFRAEGTTELATLMEKFTKAYQKNSGNGAGRRLKVVYAK